MRIHDKLDKAIGLLTAILLPFVCTGTERDVTVVNEGVRLAGTLSLPEGKAKAAIIFLTGSGPQDRDETIGRHKPFRVISDSLVCHGYATLRLDDRGTGASEGDAMRSTIETEALDASTAIAWCQTLPELRKVPVGLFGHSQGGAVAIALAGSGSYFPQPQFIITYGAPTVKGTDMMLAQVRALLDGQGQGAAWEQMAPMLQRRYTLVASDLDDAALLDTLRADVLATIPQQMQTQAMMQQVEKETAVMASAPYRSLMRFDPTEWLQYIEVPWLCLYGANDLQVPPQANTLPRHMPASTTRMVLSGLNHLGQKCDSGMPTLYQSIDETVNPTLINTMTEWLDGLNLH